MGAFESATQVQRATVEQVIMKNESEHKAEAEALRKRERQERFQAFVAVLQAVAALTHIVLEPYALCFDDHSLSIYSIGYFVDAVNVVCCCIELRWARQAIGDASDETELQKRHRELNRLRVETVAVLPVDAVLWLHRDWSSAVAYVRLLRLVQALRLARYLGHLLVSVRVSYSTGQAIFSLVIFFWVTHWVACSMFLVAAGDSSTYFASAVFIRKLSGAAADDGENEGAGTPNDEGRAHAYLAALYWAVGSVFRNGNPDPMTAVDDSSWWELLFNGLIDTCSMLLNNYLIAIITIILLRKQTSVDSYREKVATIDQYLQRQKVRASLRRGCLDYFRHTFQHGDEVDEVAVLSRMPYTLRTEIMCDMFLPTVSQAPLFRGLDYAFVAAVCPLLRRAIFLKGEVLCREGEFQRQLHIVEAGVVSKFIAGRRAASGTAVATLRVHLQSAAGLAAADSNGLSDPYVKVSGAGQAVLSRTVQRSLEPIWEQEVELTGPASELRSLGVTLEVFDRDRLGRHPSLGYAMLQLTDAVDGETRELERRLLSRPGGVRATGTLKFAITFTVWQGTASAPASAPAAATSSAAAEKGRGAAPSAPSDKASSDGGEGGNISEWASTAPTADARPTSLTRRLTMRLGSSPAPGEMLPPGIKLRMGAGATPNAAAFVANLRSLTTVWAESKTTCLELSRGDFIHLLSDFDENAAELGARVLQAARDEGDDATARQLSKKQGSKEVAASVVDLMNAVIDGNAGLVKALLLEAGNPNLSDHHGQTAMHLAASEGAAKIIGELLALGADVSLPDRLGVTPLQLALRQGRPKAARLLVANGAELLIDANELAATLCEFSRASSLERLSLYLECGADVNACDYDRRTALHLASSEGNLPIISFLLEHGAYVNATDRWGNTPMRDAVRERHFQAAQELRGHGGALGMSEEQLSSELCELSRRGHVESLERLLECGADFDAKDYDSRTALHLAASVGSVPIIQTLLDAGAAVNATDRWGGTPLRDAVREGRPEAAALLHSRGGELAYTEAEASGELCELAKRGRVDVLQLMLRCGCDVNAADYDDRTALHLASSEGNLPCVTALLDAGAAVNATDRWGGTPLRDAVRQARRDVEIELRSRGGELSCSEADASGEMCENRQPAS